VDRLKIGIGLLILAIALSAGGYAAYRYVVSRRLKQWIPLAEKYGSMYGVDPRLIIAQIRQESGGNPNAISSAGAIGLMQIMPATGASECGLTREQLFDPELNIRCGVKYLRKLYDQFRDWKLALAAYNAGPGAVTRYRGIPPYRETQNYVASIMSYYRTMA
jgi:Soluble lytic murein transglycosylase and related regulatory proteins (some contain LysM/invasin domains)